MTTIKNQISQHIQKLNHLAGQQRADAVSPFVLPLMLHTDKVLTSYGFTLCTGSQHSLKWLCSSCDLHVWMVGLHLLDVEVCKASGEGNASICGAKEHGVSNREKGALASWSKVSWQVLLCAMS